MGEKCNTHIMTLNFCLLDEKKHAQMSKLHMMSNQTSYSHSISIHYEI
jgi:hypothetical protein